MSRYTHLLFDADDTLFDFGAANRNAFSQVCQYCGLTYTQELFELYESINQPLWRQLDQGLVTKEFLVVERFRRFLERMGIANYFSYVLGSDNVARHKPDPEPVLQTLRERGYDASEALVVGDMPVDIAMAHGAGVRAIAVTFGNATREELVVAKADYIVDDFTHILDIVDRV